MTLKKPEYFRDRLHRGAIATLLDLWLPSSPGLAGDPEHISPAWTCKEPGCVCVNPSQPSPSWLQGSCPFQPLMKTTKAGQRGRRAGSLPPLGGRNFHKRLRHTSASSFCPEPLGSPLPPFRLPEVEAIALPLTCAGGEYYVGGGTARRSGRGSWITASDSAL